MSFEIMVFCSGGGGNLRKVLEGEGHGLYSVTSVITDRPCGAESVARSFGKEHLRVEARPPASFPTRLLSKVSASTKLIVLAGYMPILPALFIDSAPCTIINTHPSLLPKFGGIGMYGVRVHQAVVESGDLETGCTVHIVTRDVDAGPILSQRKLAVEPNEDPWALGKRVFELEGPLLVEVISLLATGTTDYG